jgi:hypothetical protein
MQRHIDVYRHKVIMGAHNKKAYNKKMAANDASYSLNSMNDTNDMGYQLEIPIDDPSQVILHKEML